VTLKDKHRNIIHEIYVGPKPESGSVVKTKSSHQSSHRKKIEEFSTYMHEPNPKSYTKIGKVTKITTHSLTHSEELCPKGQNKNHEKEENENYNREPIHNKRRLSPNVNKFISQIHSKIRTFASPKHPSSSPSNPSQHLYTNQNTHTAQTAYNAQNLQSKNVQNYYNNYQTSALSPIQSHNKLSTSPRDENVNLSPNASENISTFDQIKNYEAHQHINRSPLQMRKHINMSTPSQNGSSNFFLKYLCISRKEEEEKNKTS
jgi:hypothetical protein